MTTDLTALPSVDPARLLAAQRAAYRREGAPSLADRRANLSKLRAALIANRSKIEAAIRHSHRPSFVSMRLIRPQSVEIDVEIILDRGRRTAYK